VVADAASLCRLTTEAEILSPLYVVCVARHEYLASHIARFFENDEVCTVGVVGVQGAVESTRSCAPDVVVCEYELLTTQPLDEWECDEVLRNTPIVAVSLTRRSNELVPLDCNGIAGFLYLPTLDSANARKLVRAAASRPRFTPGVPAFTGTRSESLSEEAQR
jgi:DNA-binding NarL/FixJ family response regulator